MLAETPVPTTESASSRRTLGVGAWVCVGWLVLLVIVVIRVVQVPTKARVGLRETDVVDADAASFSKGL